MATTAAVNGPASLPHMTSVERISKLPVVEQSVDLANSIYGRVKDSNPIVRTVLSTAETTVKGAVDMTLPVTTRLGSPIKMVDSLLCTSLDFVETNLPGVKLPPDQMYKATKDYVFGIPAVKCACQIGEQGVRKAVECACMVSEYSNEKLHVLKDSLAITETDQQKTDTRNFFSVYLYTLLHILTTLSAWVGLGKAQELQQTPKTEEKTTGNTDISQKQANGNSHVHKREPSEEKEGEQSESCQ